MIKIIADNGGSLTLQYVYGDRKYQHSYDDMTKAAEDLNSLVTGDDGEAFAWDGNEAEECWIDPTDDQIRNGGYNVHYYIDNHGVLEWGVDTSWHNVDAFTSAYHDLINA